MCGEIDTPHDAGRELILVDDVACGANRYPSSVRWEPVGTCPPMLVWLLLWLHTPLVDGGVRGHGKEQTSSETFRLLRVRQ